LVRAEKRWRKRLGLPPSTRSRTDGKPWRDKHVESDIFFDHDPDHGLVVIKRYRSDQPCIAWLNQHLAQYYAPADGMPVAQHEYAALHRLAPLGIAPEPLRREPGAVVMRYAGEPINSPNGEVFLDLHRQFREIVDALDHVGFKHNDMLPRNVLAHHGTVRLVDFTLSEFDGISTMDALPEPAWARPGKDRELLTYYNVTFAQLINRWHRLRRSLVSKFPASGSALDLVEPPRRRLRRLARGTYNYHNLGSGIFPAGEEKTPYGSGERYNFDRMYMMVSNYDFTGKSVMDLGCNSGWFAIQLKLLGSAMTIGIDHQDRGEMGQAIRYAQTFERAHKLGIHFLDRHLEETDLRRLLRRYGLEQMDGALVLSVLHHIGKTDLLPKSRFFAQLHGVVRDVIFYEDHEFWNEIVDERGYPVPTPGEGYRFGWNEDLSWQQRMGALEPYGPRILDAYRRTWRRDVLLLDRWSEVRFLGFSEKRRPMFAFFK
jgi:2-polyprenyl-3-methyl-5-hydroxy-6-metoxy-1,4-benzoquinol methylase